MHNIVGKIDIKYFKKLKTMELSNEISNNNKADDTRPGLVIKGIGFGINWK